MGFLNEFIETLTKRKLVGFFLALWGMYFFFIAVDGFYYVSNSLDPYYFDIIDILLCVLHDLLALLIALVLLLLGLMVLGINILSTSAESQQKNGEVAG